jgi:hypothetical protein
MQLNGVSLNQAIAQCGREIFTRLSSLQLKAGNQYSGSQKTICNNPPSSLRDTPHFTGNKSMKGSACWQWR